MIALLRPEEYESLPVAVLPPEFGRGEDAGCNHCPGYRPEPQLSGNLQVDPEIHLPSAGMDVDIAYYYNAVATNSGPFGYARQLSTNLTAQAKGTHPIVTLTRANGALVSYQDDGAGNFVARTPGLLNSLSKDVGNSLWKETTLDGHITAYPLDTTGQISSLSYREDAVGNRQTFSYASGLLSTIQDAVGRLVTFGYSGGLLSSIQDWANRRTTFQYDTASASPKSLLTTVTGPTGCQTQYSYATFLLAGSTSDWLLSRITSPNGYNTDYAYDQQRRVVTRTVAGAGVWTYLYQPGFMLTVDPLGSITTQSLGDNYSLKGFFPPTGGEIDAIRNPNLQLTNYTNPLGNLWTTSYDGSGNVVGTIDPLGNRVTYSRDSFNNITAVQTMNGAIVTNIWGYAGSSFDTTGAKRRLQAVVNQLGFRTSFTYNGRGQIASEQNALGFLVTHSYDSFANRVSTQDALGNRWTQTFDLAGNITAQTNPLGARWSTSFDNQNRPLTQTDPLGNIQTVAYDSVGNRTVLINPLGFRTSWTFNVFDKPDTMKNALGNVWTSVYDAIGNAIASVDPLGNRSTTVFDVSSRPVASVNPLGFRTTSVFDNANRVIARQDALGYFSTTVFDAANRIIAGVDALGFRTTTNFDNLNRPVSTQNALGYLSTTVFDLAGQAIGSVDALGFRASTQFDGAGRAVAAIDALGFRTSQVFDANGRTVASQDALGRYSTTVFDAAGRRVASVDALGFRWSSSFDAANRPISATDPLNRTNTTVFDAAGQTTAFVTPLGYRTSFTLDGTGRGVATQDARGNISSTVFDAANRAIATVSPLGFYTSTIFDAASQRVALQDALGFLHSAVFDGAGQAIASVDPLNFRSTSVFNGRGEMTATVDALANRSTSVFDAVGQPVAAQSALGNLTTTVFDAVGQAVALVDANSHRTTSQFNGRHDLVSTQDALGAFTSWQYDAVGNESLRIDARNWPATYTVDALNRRTGTLYINGTRVTNTFDAAGQQLTQQDLLGIRSFGHDLDGRQTSVAFPTGLNLTMSFDPVSNRLSLLDPDNGRTSWSYDAQNRIVGIANPFAELTTIVWDALNREQRKTLANGMVVSHTFDAAGRETLIENRKSAGTGLAIFTSTYDSVSNRLTVLELDGTRCTFGYDATYQLTLEQRSGVNAYNTSYVYDPLGNRLQKFESGALTSSQYNAANELILSTPPSGAPTTSTWDQNGNLATQVSGAARTTYTWDPENRLLTLSESSTITTAAYSTDGLRQKKVVAAATTNFVWDDQNVLQERDGSLSKTAQYTDWPGYWGGLVSQRRSTTSSFLAYDSQPSTRILVSIGGLVTDSYSFKAFGEELAAGSGTVNPHRYVGQFGYLMDAANKYYVRARYPDVGAGRWIGRDPVGSMLWDPNCYRYVGNQPSGLIDPSGLYELYATQACVDDCTMDPCKYFADHGGWAEAQRQAGNEGTVFGLVFCCKGVKYPCTNPIMDRPGQPIRPYYRYCVRRHERRHIEQGCVCKPLGATGLEVCKPALGDPDYPRTECDAYTVTLKCLADAAFACTLFHDANCLTYLAAVIADVCKTARAICKEAGMPERVPAICDVKLSPAIQTSLNRFGIPIGNMPSQSKEAR